jgi:hypothetical protein
MISDKGSSTRPLNRLEIDDGIDEDDGVWERSITHLLRVLGQDDGRGVAVLGEG